MGRRVRTILKILALLLFAVITFVWVRSTSSRTTSGSAQIGGRRKSSVSHAGRFSWHGPAEVRAPVNFSVVLHQQTVTRLRPNGSVDRTFGRGGKWTVPAGTIGRFSELVV